MIGRGMVTAASVLALIQGSTPVLGGAAAQASGSTHADSAEMTVFEPRTFTTDDYTWDQPEVFPVKAPDGADMYVELWRPVRGPKGIEPPPRYPVILNMTPYEGVFPAAVDDANPVEGLGSPPDSPYHDQIRNRFVPKGYAVAIGHIYGTGNSEGCRDLFGPRETAAASAVVEALGTASWSNGRVGMIGTSYDAGEALHVAAMGSKGARDHLAAVVADAGMPSWADQPGYDGVPLTGVSLIGLPINFAITQLPAPLSPAGVIEPDPAGTADRQAGACRAEHAREAANFERTGDFSAWWADRSARPGARSIQAATLMFQGFHDFEVTASTQVGFFERIPKRTPHKLMMAQWGHAETNLYRADSWAMRQAWFDRFLLDHPTGAEDWPQVQVQDSTGRWRPEPDWPSTGGPVGQLALSDGLTLGADTPVGATSYVELGRVSTDDPTEVTFSTPPLGSPLHLVGQPVLDLWVVLDRDDAHIAAVFEAFDEEGNPITSEGALALGDASGRVPIVALRSAQHLDPIRNGEFRQTSASPASVGEPVHVPVRFFVPVDVVVPAGGKVSLRIGGTSLPEYQSAPSGSGTRVQILHDCEHPSALRFLMPPAEPDWLDVAMNESRDQPQLVAVDAPEEGLRDGGGLATAKVCGEKPLDPREVVGHP